MEDLKRRKINMISLAYNNTLVITGQKNKEESVKKSKKGLIE